MIIISIKKGTRGDATLGFPSAQAPAGIVFLPYNHRKVAKFFEPCTTANLTVASP